MAGQQRRAEAGAAAERLAARLPVIVVLNVCRRFISAERTDCDVGERTGRDPSQAPIILNEQPAERPDLGPIS